MAGIVPSGKIRELPQEELESMPVDGIDGGEPEETSTIVVDPKTGSVIHYQSDGSAIIDTKPKEKENDKSEEGFDANLAVGMDETYLAQIADEIVEGVEDDLRTRSEFETMFERAVDLLGIKIEKATGQAGTDGTISTAYSPLLLEAVVKYQANFIAEMLPSGGPAKVRDDSSPAPAGSVPTKPIRDELSEAFEKDLNHYLTVTAKEFYPDTDRMAFSQGLFGNGFKKQFHCPLRRRPVSESVPMQDLIVSNNVTDLDNAIRITHRSRMTQVIMKRMQLNKSYRKVDVPLPTAPISRPDEKIARVEGTDKTPQKPVDQTYEIFETMVDYDLQGYEHKEDGEITGLPLPYIITVERDSKVVLSIRRNWKEDDPDYRKKLRIVHYPLIPALGFYALGFIHLLGNNARALTGITRLLLDAGMFATFPGFLIAKSGGKQATTELRVNPGTAKEIDCGGKPIQDVLMKIPYGEPSPTLQKMGEKLEEDGMRIAGASEIPVGEGRADVPVGTMMAAVEQATKIVAAIHKRNHSAQQQELINIRELFLEDPAALSKFAGRKASHQWEAKEEFEDLDLVPASDPNVPSQIHRIMIATALIQLSGSPAGMQIYNQLAVHERALRVLGIDDADGLFNPPAPPGGPPPDPMVAIKQKELDIKAQELPIKAAEQQREANQALIENQARENDLRQNLQNDEANRQHQEKLAQMKAQTEAVKEREKGIAVSQKEHISGIHDLVQKHVEHLHEKSENERQREHEKEIAAKAAQAAKAKPKQPKKEGKKK